MSVYGSRFFTHVIPKYSRVGCPQYVAILPALVQTCSTGRTSLLLDSASKQSSRLYFSTISTTTADSQYGLLQNSYTREYSTELASTWHRLIKSAHSPAQLRAILHRLCYKHPQPHHDTLELILQRCIQLSHERPKSISTSNNNQLSLQTDLYAVIQEIHQYLQSNASLSVYNLLLTAYAECGAIDDATFVLTEMREAGLWPDYTSHLTIVTAQAATGSFSLALDSAYTGSQQLARQLYLRRGLKGTLWIGYGFIGLKWASMMLAGMISEPHLQSLLWLGTGMTAFTLAIHVMVGIWITPTDTPIKAYGQSKFNTHHRGNQTDESSVLLLLTRRDIKKHLETMAVQSLLAARKTR
ncbi:hypothetical protein BDF19DRAFT_447163 [Syncephalis fuscata]|nr:hypothetical protein BDF19DRAFT_447163 [Syncephalis fuscata]